MADGDACELLCIDLPKAEQVRAAALEPSVLAAAACFGRALGDETRLALAHALAQTEELCVCDLAWISGRPQNLVSHHLRQLRLAGLASSRRERKMVLYRLTDAGRRLVEQVLAVEGAAR